MCNINSIHEELRAIIFIEAETSAPLLVCKSWNCTYTSSVYVDILQRLGSHPFSFIQESFKKYQSIQGHLEKLKNIVTDLKDEIQKWEEGALFLKKFEKTH